MKVVKKLIIAIVILSLFSGLFAEEEKSRLTVKIEQIDSKDYPEVTAYSLVRNSKGEDRTGLAPGLFSFRVDNQEVKVKSQIFQFGITEEAVDYTILVSNNGIMDGEPLDYQKNAILKFVEMMDDQDQLSVFALGGESKVVFENVLKKDFDPNLVNAITISDEQPRLYDSIINILRNIEQKKIRRRILIVLSDGRDQNSRFSKDELTTVIREIGLPIYSIGMKVLSVQTLSTLDELSELSGGTYFYIPRVKQLPEKIKYVVDCVNDSYVINLKIRGVNGDNQLHLLEVKVDERDATGKGERTFNAVKHPIPKWLKILLVVVAVLFVLVLIVIAIILRIRKRKSMGITKRTCPVCGNRMKDAWDYCPFCRYMPDIKKKKKKNKDLDPKKIKK